MQLLMYRRASGSDYDVATSNSAPDPTSWRAGLRKTGSTGAVPETSSMSADKKLTSINAVKKSASSGVISENVSDLSRYVPYKTPTSSTMILFPLVLCKTKLGSS